MKKIILVLILLIVVNLCCWKVESFYLDHETPVLLSEIEDIIFTHPHSISNRHRIYIFMSQGGSPIVNIFWDDYVVNDVVYAGYNWDNKYQIFPGLGSSKISSTKLESETAHLIWDFQQLPTMIFLTDNVQGISIIVKFSFAGFTDAYVRWQIRVREQQ